MDSKVFVIIYLVLLNTVAGDPVQNSLGLTTSSSTDDVIVENNVTDKLPEIVTEVFSPDNKLSTDPEGLVITHRQFAEMRTRLYVLFLIALGLTVLVVTKSVPSSGYLAVDLEGVRSGSCCSHCPQRFSNTPAYPTKTKYIELEDHEQPSGCFAVALNRFMVRICSLQKWFINTTTRHSMMKTGYLELEDHEQPSGILKDALERFTRRIYSMQKWFIDITTGYSTKKTGYIELELHEQPSGSLTDTLKTFLGKVSSLYKWFPDIATVYSTKKGYIQLI